MKQWFAVSMLALAVCVPAAAIEYRISLGERGISGDERVRRLELAVEELQRKVFQLQADAAAPKSNPKAFFCEVTGFGKNYQAFGATRLEAESDVKKACDEGAGAMFCKEVKCRENQ